MNIFTKKAISAVFAAGLWISFSEFLRNELLFKSYWVNHYKNLGIVFPSEPVNGMVWGIWSFVFAGLIYAVSRRFSFIETISICFTAGFILMWLVIGNMGVLPYKLLLFAVPLALVEVSLAVFIVRKIDSTKN